ncbi:type VI secretion system membrane subunit TssM [Sphingomonas arantia]|uniref:Type VI secretion system membrane subunit TssM n=1 Tax=Sphingomonas arantia TaxID=1460676 RepID=A0ABW4U192_9SPHN
MKKLMQGWWALAAPAAIILMLLGTLGLPTLFPALRATWFRMLLIALVALGLVGAACWRWWSGRRASDRLVAGLTEQSAADAETVLLEERMRDAVAQLKSQAGAGRDYLYKRPWYVIIGPPGAGKTTALANSGMRFPLSDGAVRGVGGTRDLDFWFADEAVLVDTAGRYTSQDSDGVADAAGWDRVLRLLRRARPLEPINGVIVALGVDELMNADRARLDIHINAIRRRLAELVRVLQVSVPVYLLLPKADLLAGFTEYFADLNAEGRRAVLGATLDPNESSAAPAVVIAFDDVVDVLWTRSAKRLEEEPGQHERGMILGFPAQFASLRQRLFYLVDGAFRGDDGTMPMLRGFYFASGTQKGTPFDRMLGTLASVYDAPHPPARSGQGRAYFLNRMLTEVMIPEGGKVRPMALVRRRRRYATIGVLTAVAMASVAMAGLWINAFADNTSLQAALDVGAREVSEEARRAGIDLAEVRATDPDLEQALHVLNRLRNLPYGFAHQASGKPPWSMRLGLFQSGHASTARLAYLEALQRILLPRLLLEAEGAMREQQDPGQLYAPLKAYLMLGGVGPLDRNAVRAWALDDWRMRSLGGADRADARAQLADHLDAMLADPDLGRVWANRRAPLDGDLIASTRASLQSLSLADHVYAVLRQRASAMGQPDWRADLVLTSGDRRAFRNGDAVLAATIPWFFTQSGYTRGYRAGVRDVRAELDRDLWVLGPDAANRSIQDQLPQIRNVIATRYARDYIAAWDALLALPRPADYFQDPAALGAITRTPSPLKVLLLDAGRNTALSSDDGSPAPGHVDAGREIQEHFRPISDFVGRDAGTDAPVDALVKAVRQAAVANAAARVPGSASSGGAVQGQLATALGELSTAGVVAPPQLKAFVDQATRSGAGAAARSGRASLGQEYSVNVLPACVQSSEGRYPFASNAAADVSSVDLQRVFGVNGQLDIFTRDRLRPLLDTGRQAWRWNAEDPVASGFSASSARQLQKAAAIRDLVAGGLALNVGVDTLGPDVTAVELSAGGTSYRFDDANRMPRPLLWNLAVLPSAHIAIFAGTRELQRLEARGPFALFRLLDKARIENAGPSRIVVRFGNGASSADLTFDLPSESNPFRRSGPFSFRCPKRL